jgi:hypothetical protein
MNTFCKLDDCWGVKLPAGGTPGDVITVTKRNGATSTVTLGHFLYEDTYGRYFEIAPVAPTTETIGDLSKIVAMFDDAKKHLKFPSIVLDGFRVNVAGATAREPGSLTITSADKDDTGRRKWLGRVTRAGVFEPARNTDPTIGEKLRLFACDPAGEAAAYGRLHGACCFCSKPLRDERSTAVGYGPTCASHFGLSWG